MNDVITHNERVEVLEQIAHDFLMELQMALRDVKVQIHIGQSRDRIKDVMLVAKAHNIQLRIDYLKYKLESIDALTEKL